MKGTHVGVGEERFIPFTDNTLKSLQVVERENIHVQTSTSDIKMATFSMTVKASEKILQPVSVFKGKPGGWI